MLGIVLTVPLVERIMVIMPTELPHMVPIARTKKQNDLVFLQDEVQAPHGNRFQHEKAQVRRAIMVHQQHDPNLEVSENKI